MGSAIIEISILLAVFILAWLKTEWAALFYIGLGLTLFYAIGMFVYLIFKGAKLSWRDRLMGVIALAGWLVIAWFMIHEKGLHILGF